MRTLFASLAVAAAVLATPAPARAQLGTTPSKLEPAKWYNSPPLTLEDLKGKAVLVEVFRTW